MASYVTKDITAQNTFTDALAVAGHTSTFQQRFFDVAVSGTFSGTVTLQLSYDGTTWIDTGDSWTEPAVQRCAVATASYIRAGIKTGDFTSGTATVRVSQ